MAWITVREACEMLDGKVSGNVVRRLLHCGDVEGTKIAGRVLVDLDSWKDYVARGKIRILMGEMPDKPSRVKRRSA